MLGGLNDDSNELSTQHTNTILIRTEHAFISYTFISLLNKRRVEHMKYSHIHFMYKAWNILTKTSVLIILWTK